MANHIIQTPSTYDYLRPNAFQFSVDILPNVSYFCQTAAIPPISLSWIDYQNPLLNIPVPGTNLDYSELTIKFIVQENFENYLEIYNWLIGLGFPDDKQQYTDWQNKQKDRFPSLSSKSFGGSGNFSDARLIVLDSDNNPVASILFQDCFPINLQGLEFDISSGDTRYLTAQVTFKYSSYRFE